MENTLKDKLNSLITENSRPTIKSVINNGSSAEQIGVCQNLLNNRIPKDYVDFLQFSDGCELFNDDDIDGFQFLGTNNIYDINKLNKEIYEEDWNENIIVFCKIIGEGNYLGFEIIDEDTYKIVDCFHELIPAEWEIIPYSFLYF